MSQVPSAEAQRFRRSRDRYPRCPVCASTDVSGTHVDRCEERERYRKAAATRAAEVSVSEVASNDLWAHVNSRQGPLVAAQVTILALDLGWRPTLPTTALTTSGTDESEAGVMADE